MTTTTKITAAFALAFALLATGSAFAGATDGEGCYRITRVDRFDSRSFDLEFSGRERAVITVEGDGDTDIDCWVYDENDNLIDEDTDYTHICRLEFTPRWTGPFQLEVENLGSVWTAIEICTN